ncbi:right-handed parallel beta-helix repeat-containing protein [Streptomyces sp. NPDC001046]|uniref:right-handed parallel beta-helix repeat-containing protein n=1 Tax=Streptomyces sp. NPDC001046 TaxID=3364543 RepID=UPI00368315E0
MLTLMAGCAAGEEDGAHGSAPAQTASGSSGVPEAERSPTPPDKPAPSSSEPGSSATSRAPQETTADEIGAASARVPAPAWQGSAAPVEVLLVRAGARGGNEFATLDAALEAARRRGPAGLLIRVQGMHTPTKESAVNLSGTRGRPLLIEGAGPGTGIDMSKAPAVPLKSFQGPNCLAVNHAEYVVVRNLTCRNNRSGAGITVYASAHVRISNTKVLHVKNAGINSLGTAKRRNRQILLDGNEVTGTSTRHSPALRPRGADWSPAVVAHNTDGVTITGNEVYENFGEGIDCLLSTGCTVSRNTVRDNWSVNVYVDNASHVSIDRNFITSTGKGTFERNSRPAAGIQLAQERYRGFVPLKNVSITHNVVSGSAAALSYYPYECDTRDDAAEACGMRDVAVAHNTFARPARLAKVSEALVVVGGTPDERTVDNFSLVNNVFAAPSHGLLEIGSGSGVRFDTNCWSNRPPQQVDTRATVGDPRFRDADSQDPKDYQVGSGSPCTRTPSKAGRPGVKTLGAL